MIPPKYQRLTGRSFGLAGSASLWLGDGHVLEVSSALAFERYRRWYLHEIQVLVARRSRKRMAWNLVWGIIAGTMLGVAAGLSGLGAIGGEPREAQIVLRVFAGVSAVIGLAGAALMLVNTLLGATCTVYVQTVRGVAPLPAPTRERAYAALLARLRPHLGENPKSEARNANQVPWP